MNDDLILRARLHQQGWSDDQIEKYIGQGLVDKYNQSRAAGHQGASLAQRILPGGKGRMMQATGMTQAEYDEGIAAGQAAKQQQARNKMTGRLQNRGLATTIDPQAPAMAQTVANPADPTQQITRTELTQQALAQAPQPQQPAAPQQPQQPAAPQQPASNVVPLPGQQPAAPQQPQQPAAAPQQPATTGFHPNARAAAQMAMVQQDAATIQQGAGGEKKTWLKDRPLTAKIGDILSGGLLAGFGETGILGRGKANRASEQQNQQYQAALQRQTQMAKSMELYRDVISRRRTIQERNTTHNLRR